MSAASRRSGFVAGIAAALLLATSVSAHVSNTGLATLKVDGDRLRLELALSAVDLAPADAALIGSAGAGDRSAAEALREMIAAAWTVEVDAKPCRLGRFSVQGSRVSDERLLLRAEFGCAAAPGRLVVHDGLAARLGEHYRTLLTIVPASGLASEHMLDRQNSRVELAFGQAHGSGWPALLLLGIEHIGGGIDHLLFLLALMLGTRGLWPTLGVVTLFTVAHSLSLALAVMGVVTVPGRIVEPLIAASIAWVGVDNLRRLLRPAAARSQAPRWAATFGFGLIHGLGFAGALNELSLSGTALAWALLGFNLGVELGQAAVVIVLLPLLALLSRSRLDRTVTLALSAALAAIGTAWAVLRLAGG